MNIIKNLIAKHGKRKLILAAFVVILLLVAMASIGTDVPVINS